MQGVFWGDKHDIRTTSERQSQWIRNITLRDIISDFIGAHLIHCRFEPPWAGLGWAVRRLECGARPWSAPAASSRDQCFDPSPVQRRDLGQGQGVGNVRWTLHQQSAVCNCFPMDEGFIVIGSRGLPAACLPSSNCPAFPAHSPTDGNTWAGKYQTFFRSPCKIFEP